MMHFEKYGLRVLCCFFFSLTLWLQTQIHHQNKSATYLLPKEMVQGIAQSFPNFLADLYFMKAQQHLGGKKKIEHEDMLLIGDYLRRSVWSDVYFEDAYIFAGQVLTLDAQTVQIAQEILQQGMHYCEANWQISFLFGFNALLFQKNIKQAIQGLDKAARTAKIPSFVPMLATRAHAVAHQPQLGVELLELLQKDPKTRLPESMYVNRQHALELELAIEHAQEAARVVKQKKTIESNLLNMLFLQKMISTHDYDILTQEQAFFDKQGMLHLADEHHRINIFYIP